MPILNGRSYEYAEHFVTPANPQQYAENYPGTSTRTFPDLVFSDFLAEVATRMAGASTVNGLSAATAGAVPVANGTQWVLSTAYTGTARLGGNATIGSASTGLTHVGTISGYGMVSVGNAPSDYATISGLFAYQGDSTLYMNVLAGGVLVLRRANTTFATLSPSAFVFGTDPGGSSTVRVGGSIYASASVGVPSSGSFYFADGNTSITAASGFITFNAYSPTYRFASSNAGASSVNVVVGHGTTNAPSTLTVGGGGNAPTANHYSFVRIDTPSSATYRGGSRLAFARGGSDQWFCGLHAVPTGAATTYTDVTWEVSGGSIVAALSTAGVFRTTGGLVLGTDPGSLALFRAGGDARINGGLVLGPTDIGGGQRLRLDGDARISGIFTADNMLTEAGDFTGLASGGDSYGGNYDRDGTYWAAITTATGHRCVAMIQWNRSNSEPSVVWQTSTPNPGVRFSNPWENGGTNVGVRNESGAPVSGRWTMHRMA